MPNRDYTNASEIGEYLYCNRAWFLKLQGYTSQNHEALTEGQAGHVHYSQQVEGVQRQEGRGRLILLAGVILLLLYFIVRLLTQ